MRGLLFIGLILIVSCSKQDSVSNDRKTTSNIKFNEVVFDSSALREIVFRNDKLLNIFKVETGNKEQADKFNAIMQSDTFRLMSYNSCKFKIMGDQKCNNYRHLLILKERNTPDIDLEPYSALYLIIIDPNDKTILTERLEERSKTLDMTETADVTTWNLTTDSIMTVNSNSHFCSDFVVDGQEMTCWTEKVTKQYKLKCSGLELMKTDSVRTKD